MRERKADLGILKMQLNDSDGGNAYQERYHEYILRKLKELREDGQS